MFYWIYLVSIYRISFLIELMSSACCSRTSREAVLTHMCLSSRWWLVSSRAAAVTWRSFRWSTWTQHRTQRVTDSLLELLNAAHPGTETDISIYWCLPTVSHHTSECDFKVYIHTQSRAYVWLTLIQYTQDDSVYKYIYINLYIYLRKHRKYITTSVIGAYFLCC